MSIDARIPLLAAQGAQFDLAGLLRQQQEQQARQQQMEMQRETMDLRREEMGWQREMQQFKMDATKAEAVKAGLKDMAAAVQWADTPEKWAQVQQHYGQHDPQLAAVPFEARESALIRLGQMGEYLEKTAPKIMSIEAGGSLAAVDPRTGQPNFTVLPNPGDQQPGASAGGGAVRVQSMDEAKRLPPGTRFIDPKGIERIVPGGAASNGSGGF